MVRQRSPTRGDAVRRITLLAVLTPLSLAASVGMLRPGPAAERPGVFAPPQAQAAEPGPVLPHLPSLRVPASVTHRSTTRPGLGVLVDHTSAPVGSVPTRAWAAYDRAAVVIGAADPTCHLSWALIAAIGDVESDHGRFGGRLMTVDGVVHPALYGPRLDGTSGFSTIDDTDAGRLDGDPEFDRAVGPMQFIPSTWMVVGVDGDADGSRDPQDIDDAALATAVYLCGGRDDLSSMAGQRRAVFRYNHSSAYVDLVLRLMNGYLAAGPGAQGVVGGPGYLPPTSTPQPTAVSTPQPTFEVVPSQSPTPSASGSPTTRPTTRPTSTASQTPTPIPTTTPPSPIPTPPRATPTAEPSALEPSTTPTEQASAPPTDGPSDAPSPTPSDGPSPAPEPSPTLTELPSQPPAPDPSETENPGGDPTAVPSEPAPTLLPDDLAAAWSVCSGSDLLTDQSELATCLLASSGRPADDPELLALLATLPSTPPSPQSRTLPSRRRR